MVRRYALEDSRSVAQRAENVDRVPLVAVDNLLLDRFMNIGLLRAHEARAHVRPLISRRRGRRKRVATECESALRTRPSVRSRDDVKN